MGFSERALREAAASAAKAGTRVYWVRGIAGASYDATPAEQGRIFTLRGARGDVRLLVAGHVQPVEDAEVERCQKCKGEFLAEFVRVHVNRDHATPSGLQDADPARLREHLAERDREAKARGAEMSRHVELALERGERG